jgi:hypothetical protein
MFNSSFYFYCYLFNRYQENQKAFHREIIGFLKQYENQNKTTWHLMLYSYDILAFIFISRKEREVRKGSFFLAVFACPACRQAGLREMISFYTFVETLNWYADRYHHGIA